MVATKIERAAATEPAAWAVLTEPQRIAMQLRTVPLRSGKRRSISQIAEIMGVSKSTVQNHLDRAREKMLEVGAIIEEGDFG